MKPRRLTVLPASLIATILVVIGLASPATAASLPEKLTVLSSWTQPTAASYDAWNAARLNQAAWADYGFDWSTDYCSASPNQPLGFDFRLPCAHHDFGYRNYRLVNLFTANKGHVDDAFYRDMRAKCTTYSSFVRPACYSVAWTYYQAVVAFGALYVATADLDRAAEMKASGLEAAAQRMA
jgi:hypothetical protein